MDARELGSGEPTRPRRLFVDLTVIATSDSGTGIQRMVRSIWQELLAMQGPDLAIVPVVSTGSSYAQLNSRTFAVSPGTSALRPASSCPQPNSGDVFLGLDLVVDGFPKARQQLLRWKEAGATVWVVAYDIIPLIHPRWFKLRFVWRFRRWFRAVLAVADGIICISSAVANEVALHAARAKAEGVPRITIVTPGSQLDRLSESEPACPHPALQGRPFVLMVGTVEPRKGHDFALDAMETVWAKFHKDAMLVVAGRPGWGTRAVQRRMRRHPRSGESLIWLDDVSDDELTWLYRNGKLLFAASKAEGFGLPIAEALSHGLPVLATNIPVFRELNAPSVRYFRKDSVEEAADRLNEMLCAGPVASTSTSSMRPWRDTATEILRHVGLSDRIAG